MPNNNRLNPAILGILSRPREAHSGLCEGAFLRTNYYTPQLIPCINLLTSFHPIPAPEFRTAR